MTEHLSNQPRLKRKRQSDSLPKMAHPFENNPQVGGLAEAEGSSAAGSYAQLQETLLVIANSL